MDNEQVHPESEYIHRRSQIFLAVGVKHLWCHVLFCAQFGGQQLRSRVKLQHAKITYLQNAITVQKEILQFQITMCPALFMEVVHSIQNLREHLPRMAFVQPFALLNIIKGLSV